MTKSRFIPLPGYLQITEGEMRIRSKSFLKDLQGRRTVREFSDRSVPKDVIQNCILAAGTAPNGANRQPWHFVVVGDQKIKHKIRIGAEEEEKAFYAGRASDEWLEALEHLGTNAEKSFLETAPYLIVIFAERFVVHEDGTKGENYYVNESAGIATGMLITAVHRAGLVSLTHTPSPMGFLNKILDRPDHERAFLILVVGYPDGEAQVPDIKKKSLDEIATFL
jgi:iodotyrosine deiodinase